MSTDNAESRPIGRPVSDSRQTDQSNIVNLDVFSSRSIPEVFQDGTILRLTFVNGESRDIEIEFDHGRETF